MIIAGGPRYPDWFAAAVAEWGANTGIFGNKKKWPPVWQPGEEGMFKKGKNKELKGLPFQSRYGN